MSTTAQNLPGGKPLPPADEQPQNTSKPGEQSQPDSSHVDPLEALLDAEAQGERWIVLSSDCVMRANEPRKIKVLAHEEQDFEQNGQTIRCKWPVPNLEINGDVIERPMWTLTELLREIGVEVVQPPTTSRKWQRIPPQTKM